jgi:hypothetical protein
MQPLAPQARVAGPPPCRRTRQSGTVVQGTITPTLACQGRSGGNPAARGASIRDHEKMSPTASHTGRRAEDDRRRAETRRGTEVKRPAQEYERELRRRELAISRALTAVLPTDRPARIRELVDARRAMSGAIRDLQRLARDLEADLKRYSAQRSHAQREVLDYEAVNGEIEEVLLRWEARNEQLGTTIDRANRRAGGGRPATGGRSDRSSARHGHGTAAGDRTPGDRSAGRGRGTPGRGGGAPRGDQRNDRGHGEQRNDRGHGETGRGDSGRGGHRGPTGPTGQGGQGAQGGDRRRGDLSGDRRPRRPR